MTTVPNYWFRKYLCSAGEYRFYRALVEVSAARKRTNYELVLVTSLRKKRRVFNLRKGLEHAA